MSTNNWTCECGTINTGSECTICAGPKPAAPREPHVKESVKQSTSSSSRPSKRALCLCSLFGETMIVNPSTLTAIQNELIPDMPMVILSACGVTGTGKSTWLNALLAEFGITTEVFKIGHTQTSETEGISVYPAPLVHPSYPGVQFLLLDLEGIGGIRGFRETTKNGISKLLIFAATISSHLAMLTNLRVDGPSIDVLQACQLAGEELKETSKIDPPTFSVMPRDTNKFSIKREQNGKTGEEGFRDILKAYMPETPAGFFDRLAIFAKPELPTSLTSQKQPYSTSGLKGSQYSAFNQKFLRSISGLVKRTPGFNDPLTLSGLVDLVTLLATAINDPNFAAFLRSSLDEVVTEVVQPMADECVKNFETESLSLGESADVQLSESAFIKLVDQLRAKHLEKFRVLAEGKVRTKRQDSKTLQKLFQTTTIRIKSTLGEIAFLNRKALAEKDEKIKAEIERSKANMEEVKAGHKKNLENLQKLMDDNAKEYAKHVQLVNQKQQEAEKQIAEMQASLSAGARTIQLLQGQIASARAQRGRRRGGFLSSFFSSIGL